MGFVMDAMANSRRLKLLTIVDDFNKDSVDIHIDRSITGDHVVEALELISQFRDYPAAIRTDQGPEITGRALDVTIPCLGPCITRVFSLLSREPKANF